MREIKFRAWVTEPITRQLEIPCMVEDWQDTIFCEWISWNDDTNGVEFMQYTGLKDKNGKEIYEGDIVCSKHCPFTSGGNINYHGTVCWDDQETGYYIDIYPVSDRVLGRAVGGCIDEYVDLEIIGNIYENEELLNGTE